jgi:Sortase domain
VIDDRRAGRGARWVLVAVLLVAAVAAAVAAGLAGRPAPPVARTFGPALEDAPASSPAALRAQVLGAAPVVAPSGRAARSGAPGTAPAAPAAPSYQVAAPFRPTRLVLPGGLSAPVSAVGLHEDGSLVIPDDPRVVGWWTGGSMPGEAYGSTVLAGHLDSASRGIGVLAALPQLRPGQVVEVTGGSRSARYRVVSARLVSQARLSHAAGLFRSDGEAQLVLITCGGPFDPVRHRYADNYVVVARTTTEPSRIRPGRMH